MPKHKSKLRKRKFTRRQTMDFKLRSMVADHQRRTDKSYFKAPERPLVFMGSEDPFPTAAMRQQIEARHTRTPMVVVDVQEPLHLYLARRKDANLPKFVSGIIEQ